MGFWHPKAFHYSKATSAGNAVHQSSASSGPIMDSIRGAVAFTMDENSGSITMEVPSEEVWKYLNYHLGPSGYD